VEELDEDFVEELEEDFEEELDEELEELCDLLEREPLEPPTPLELDMEHTSLKEGPTVPSILLVEQCSHHSGLSVDPEKKLMRYGNYREAVRSSPARYSTNDALFPVAASGGSWERLRQPGVDDGTRCGGNRTRQQFKGGRSPATCRLAAGRTP
jgi:hypothetical protein